MVVGLLIEAGSVLDQGVKLRYEHMLRGRIRDIAFMDAAFSVISKIQRNKFLLGPVRTMEFYAKHVFPGEEKIYSKLSIPGLWRHKIPQSLRFRRGVIKEVYFFVSNVDVPNADGLVSLARKDQNRDKENGRRGEKRIFDDNIIVSIVTLGNAKTIPIRSDSVRQLKLYLTEENLNNRVDSFLEEHSI